MGNGFVGWFSRSYKGIIIVLVAIMAGTLTILAMQHVSASASPDGAEPAPVPTFQSTPKQQRPVVAFVGDSYTGGTGATSKSKAFPQILQVKERWRITVSACGGGGYVNPGNCGSPYKDHLNDVIAAHPSIVIIGGGRNDTRFPAADVQANATAVVQTVRDALPDAKVYVTSPVWDDDAPTDQFLGVQAAVKAATAAAGAAYLEVGEPLVGHSELMSQDGVHPNDAGHAAIADAIAAALPKG